MADSRSGSDEPLYILRESVLRDAFAKPVGEVFKDKAALAEAVSGRYIVSVGDIVTLDLLESGIIPNICIVDYITRRMPIDEVRKRFSSLPQPQEEVRVTNPPGMISRALWDAIRDCFRKTCLLVGPKHVRIVVDGEEDLAALACIMLAPAGTRVVYGIPNVGATVINVDEELKIMVRESLDKMRP